MQKINAIRGMNDLLPKDAAAWSYLERTLADLTRAYGYEQIRTPIVEATALFQRGIGEVLILWRKRCTPLKIDSMENSSHCDLKEPQQWCVPRLSTI